jgi:hypothetical protein
MAFGLHIVQAVQVNVYTVVRVGQLRYLDLKAVYVTQLILAQIRMKDYADVTITQQTVILEYQEQVVITHIVVAAVTVAKVTQDALVWFALAGNAIKD